MAKKSKYDNYVFNKYQLSEDWETVIGTLSDGDKYKFSICDFEKVLLYSWYPTGEGRSNKTVINNKREYFHRYIMNAPKGYEVDHIDQDRLNNCRSNLRICTHQQNQCNQPLQVNNTSGVTGVRFYKARHKFVARIKFHGKDVHLGYYENIHEAIQARNYGAELLFGEYAVINDVPEANQLIKNYVYEKCKRYLPRVEVAI